MMYWLVGWALLLIKLRECGLLVMCWLHRHLQNEPNNNQHTATLNQSRMAVKHKKARL